MSAAETRAREGMAASAARDHALELTVGLARGAGEDAAARIVAAFADELAEGLDLSPAKVAARAKRIIAESGDT